MLALGIWKVFWKLDVWGGTLKCILDSKDGEPTWLVIKPWIHFKLKCLLCPARVDRSSAIKIVCADSLPLSKTLSK